MLKYHTIVTTSLAIVTLAANCNAGNSSVARDERPTTSAEKKKSVFDEIWSLPTVYKNPDSDWLNEVRFIGRAHFDQYLLDSSLGANQDWVVRRLRVGLRAQMLKHLTAHVEVDLDPQNDDPAYRRLTTASLSWKFSDAFRLTLGRQSAYFTLDGAMSSNELLTVDRSNVANNFWFPEEYIPGVTISGKSGNWVYQAGFFSGGSSSKEFGNFDAGNFGLASLGYDFGSALGVKKALLRADYVYNQRDIESTFTRRLENVGTLAFVLEDERWGLSAEISGATGYGGQGSMVGFVVMPWYNISDKLQVVARYTCIHGEEENSIRLGRYENTMTSGRGDDYNEGYLGLNYFIYGHKLKVQTGVSYASMRDSANDGGRYDGWNWTTALRISW